MSIAGTVSAPPGTAPANPRARLRIPLAVKFAAAVVGLVVLVLIADGAANLWLSYGEGQRAALEVQQEQAEAAAVRIDQFVSEIENQIGWTTRAEWRRIGLEQQRYDFIRLLRQAPAITELFYIDGEGREQLKVSRLEPDSVASLADHSAEPRFTEAVANGTWFGPVTFRRGSEPYMTIAVAHAGRAPGVTIAEVNLKLIWDVVNRIGVGESGYAYVVGPNGKLIAHPDMSLVLRETDMTALPQVAAALAPGATEAEANTAAVAEGLEGDRVLTAYAPIPRLGWAVFVQSPVGEALAPVYRLLTQSGLLLVFSLLLAGIVGTLLARRMVVPIQRLQAGAERLGEGDLSQRIAIRSGDEIETLADRFNVMAGRIQDSYETLEARVAERTRDLDESLQQQTATADVLKVISRSAFDLQIVLDTLVESAVRLCRADKGGIVRSLDGGFRYVATYGYPESFRAYVDANPPAPGRGSAVGRVVEERQIVQIEDVLADPDYRAAAIAEAGGFRAVLAVPLMREGELIGVFAMTRVQARSFKEREIELVTTFADQAVIAIANVRLFEEVQARNREVTEALEQQTATSDILRVISSSPTDVQPVFDMMAERAARLCGARLCFVYRFDGSLLHFTAQYGLSPEAVETMRRVFPMAPGRGTAGARAVLSGAVEQIPDVLDDAEYSIELARMVNSRSVVAVPILREGVPVGAIALDRAEVGYLPERQIELLRTFADQAVIAIENVRLFTALEERNHQMAEALEQQTATSAILRAIAASPTDIQPVLDTVTESAAKLCDAYDAALFLRQGEVIAVAAHHGAIPIDFKEMPLQRGIVTSRAVLDRAPVHVHDLTAAEDEFPEGREYALRLGFRSILAVPLLREGEAIGALMIRRQEARPFSAKQIGLLGTFADQAVIAIENVRLFEEVQARNRELSEALEQQTATSAILKAIAASPTDIKPVLNTVAESATKLCDAYDAVIGLREGQSLDVKAHYGPIPVPSGKMPIGRDWPAGRALVDRQPVHVHDLTAAAAEFPAGHALAVRDGFRTSLAVPLLREGEAIGILGIRRNEVRPFTEKQIELLSIFADQAVIAIENVRLFEEVQARTAELSEALDQQTATADVLKVISRSAFDLKTVLETLVESATKLCGGREGTMWLRKGDQLFAEALFNESPMFIEAVRDKPFPIRSDGENVSGRAAALGEIVHVADIRNDPVLAASPYPRIGGYRSVLAVPLLRSGFVEGVFVLTRPEAGPFTARQIDLVQTFADQAVIAIENVRLFQEVQAKTRDLEESLTFQKATGDVLEVIGRSTSELRPVLDIIVETAAELCGADMAVLRLLKEGGLHHAASSSRIDLAVARHSRDNLVLPLDRSSTAGRVGLDGRTIHIHDVTADPDYTYLQPLGASPVRTSLGVPLLQEGGVVGVIVLLRKGVDPFTDRQIALVQTFADQAVIAIGNVRLFEEVQARTTELAEALRQQTATADVLKTISRSTFDLPAVLNALVASAAALCNATYGGIFLRDGEMLRGHATICERPEVAWGLEHLVEINPKLISGRVALSGSVEHIPDVLADPEYDLATLRQVSDTRALMGIPLLRDGKVDGVFFLGKPEPGGFTVRQSELVQTFADQAVIAIENVRLFEEVQARTAELGESLRQQTATADVLKVISRSTFDLQTVLDTLVESAARVCEADQGTIFQRDGDLYRFAASYGFSGDLDNYARANPHLAGRDSLTGRAALKGETVHVADILADPEYQAIGYLERTGSRTGLGVPLLRERVPIGVFVLTRSEMKPFSEKQIELVETFADQAVIAIENVRLFDEVQARTRELTQSLDELRTAQDRLVQTEKLASLGQLTAGIAHEIKNPLNFVNNFSALSGELIGELGELLDGASLDDKLREEVAELTGMLKGNLEKVVQHGKRADSIVKNMLLHSREGSGEHRPMDINAIVEESLNLAYHGARAEKRGFNITLEKFLDPEAGEVDLFPQEITRVLLNLISNGFYATTKRNAEANGAAYEPTLTASTRNLGDDVEIRIRDNGTGIPAEVKEKMFNPFFTTKPAGEGTGLGLSLSHDIIVKQHAGTIEVDTQPGEFTEFRIVLPRRGAEAALAKAGEAA